MREAKRIRSNRRRGEDDDDAVMEWEGVAEQVDFESGEALPVSHFHRAHSMSDELPDRDLIHGIAAVAAFLGVTTRQAKYWHSIGRMPSFVIGKTVCARRSSMR